MDMFMDKLAQKLTAQEIIKANTAADVEELNKLKNQIAEYNECLAKLQKLIDDGAGRLESMREEAGGLAIVVTDNTKAQSQLQQEVEEFKGLLGGLRVQIDGMDRLVKQQTEAVSESLGGRIDQLCGQLEAQESGGLSERLDIVEENVHKECVKVYRNVQAVMVEESGKQGEALEEARAGIASAKGRIGAVLGISVAALIVSIASVAVQLLFGFGMLP